MSNTLIYMPYFESANRGVKAAQAESLKAFETYKFALNPQIYTFLLQSQHERGNREDRLGFINSIWCKSDIIMIESTKAPSVTQIIELSLCEYGLCSQHYVTNVMQGNGTVVKFPAHKNIVDGRLDLARGCTMTMPDTKRTVYLEYCTELDDFADVSDLGIIKISQAFQLAHKDLRFLEDSENRYNDVERLHVELFKLKHKWHRHKEAAYRNPLFHLRNSAHESEYLTEQEMRDKLGIR